MTAPADDAKVAKAASNRILRVVARGVKEAGRADMRKSRASLPHLPVNRVENHLRAKFGNLRVQQHAHRE